MPPDFFSPIRPLRNPLYRWSEYVRDGCAWWVRSIRCTFNLVDMRAATTRGLAGYWEIQASEPTAEKSRWLPGPGAALFKAIDEALRPTPITAEDLA